MAVLQYIHTVPYVELVRALPPSQVPIMSNRLGRHGGPGQEHQGNRGGADGLCGNGLGQKSDVSVRLITVHT